MMMLRTLSRKASNLGNLTTTTRQATSATIEWAKNLNKSLQDSDPDLFNIIEQEKIRQRDSLVLIASENFTSRAVFDALGSVMSNKYSEGYPSARYYGGNENIDKAESLCQKRWVELSWVELKICVYVCVSECVSEWVSECVCEWVRSARRLDTVSLIVS